MIKHTVETTWRGYQTALFVNTYLDRPVMHLWGGIKRNAAGHSVADVTLCGRTSTFVYLSVKHALKFGRKCSLCDRIAARKEDTK